MKIKVKEVVRYGGHSLSEKGIISLTLKGGYSELTNTILLMQMLNNDVMVKAKIPNEEPTSLGTFRLKQVTIDGDGASVIKLGGISDYVELDNLNNLPMNDSDVKEFQVMFSADIEKDEDGYEEEE